MLTETARHPRHHCQEEPRWLPWHDWHAPLPAVELSLSLCSSPSILRPIQCLICYLKKIHMNHYKLDKINKCGNTKPGPDKAYSMFDMYLDKFICNITSLIRSTYVGTPSQGHGFKHEDRHLLGTWYMRYTEIKM